MGIGEVAELLSLVVGDPYWRLIMRRCMHGLDVVAVLLQILYLFHLIHVLLLLQLRESPVDQLSVHLRVGQGCFARHLMLNDLLLGQ